MKFSKTMKALGLTAAVALAPLMASSAQAAGTLTTAVAIDPASWDPIDTFLVDWSSAANNIYDGLTARGADMKLTPALATSWEFLDDNKRIRFKLRENVKFHNGEPFNAQAVKFTFDRLLGEEGRKGPQQSNYNSIERVEVVDDNTVDFIMKQPDPVLLTKLAGYGAMIVPPKYVQEKGDDYFNTHPVGTGPFKFVEYNPKDRLILEANPDHWGGAPKLDRLVFRFISEANTQVAELQAGRIDVATLIPFGLAPTIEKSQNLSLMSVTGPTVVSLRFNTKDGITKDVNVRKALIMGVDRDAIIKAVLLGHGKPIASFQSELSFGNDPALKPLPFDLAKAKQMLQAAKVPAGAPVRIDFRGNDATFREVAQATAGYLQALGLKPALQPHEPPVLLNDIIPNGKTGEAWHQAWGGWTFDYDNNAYLMYHSGEKWNPYYNDAKLNEMLEKQRLVYDVKEREKILQEIARYVADQALELPLYNQNTIYGVNKRVKDFDAPADRRFRYTKTSVE
ncbi:ABC transporter substrate-binding protein [Microvirga guangxiensis]|uniref:Peptide/nickel transport system substrate-binding protein n=1 Tax=Microvirga guangxiensis TaxID=549386 RepID=A0A1G5HWZ4_9HYPH|nr:ABC transporter substrate-binding protein [Microvirga guangxiensis]SCY68244.1 peptide/nickel transport system substrate-binding protein [Microvirga guangxiensis]